MVTGLGSSVYPVNQAERMFTFVIAIISALIVSLVVAIVRDQLAAYVNDPRKKKLDDVATFIRFHQLPVTLARKLRKYHTVRLEHNLNALFAARSGPLYFGNTLW